MEILCTDGPGRCVIADERTIDGTSFATDYAYDLADNQTQITYPTGRIVNLTRDALGRVSEVTTQDDAAGAARGLSASEVSDLAFTGRGAREQRTVPSRYAR